MRGASEVGRSQYVGDVLAIEDGWARVEVKNHFALGDRIEVMHPGGNRDITIERLLADDGSAIEVAPGSGHVVRMPLQDGLEGAMLSRYV
jgi:putative protease